MRRRRRARHCRALHRQNINRDEAALTRQAQQYSLFSISSAFLAKGAYGEVDSLGILPVKYNEASAVSVVRKCTAR
jgi:hypothetical protein